MASKSLTIQKFLCKISSIILKLFKRKSKISLENEFYNFETTSPKISQSTVQKVTAGYIETYIEQFKF